MLIVFGSITILYVPVFETVWVLKLKLALLEVEVVTCVPSGFSNLTVTLPIKVLVIRTVTCCPVVALKLTKAFCPTRL
jgi:hypothetical protein